MDGWWDSESIDQLVYRISMAGLDEKVRLNGFMLARLLAADLMTWPSMRNAFLIGEKHYDLGNDLFQNMLDKRMNYSCAYWKDAGSLDEAQENKLDLICRKIYLQPGMRVLDIACKCLSDDGLFLLHTIGNYKSVKTTDLWIKKYIFPVGMIPSVAQLGKPMENLFIMEDWHNFGLDYDKTLMAWYDNFVKNRDKISDKYSDRFFRMWEFYLLSAAGSFRSRRRDQLWQIVLSRNGVPGGYRSVR